MNQIDHLTHKKMKNMKITTVKPSVGYGQVQTEVMISNELSIYAKLLYAYYCSVQGGKDSSWKSTETILEDLGIGLSTFKKAKKELVDAGLITSTKRMNDSAVVSVRYLIQPIVRVTTQPIVRGAKQPSNSNIEYKQYNTNNTNTITSETSSRSITKTSILTEEEQYIYERIKESNEELGKETINWEPNTKDKKKLAEIAHYNLMESELTDLLTSLQSRNKIKYISVASLHNLIFKENQE